MASEKQIAANRQNAAKSTGPKSAAGKQVVSMNALQHGLQAEHVVIPGEDPEEFMALVRGLEEHYQPVGSLEQGLIERIAHCTWRLQRAGVIESTIMRREHWELESERARAEKERARRSMDGIASAFDDDPYEEGDEDESDEDHNLPAERAEALWRDYEKEEKALNQAGEAYERAEAELKSLSCGVDRVFWQSWARLERVSRYETKIERQLRNAMQNLERTQAARKAEAAESATVIDVTDLNEGEG